MACGSDGGSGSSTDGGADGKPSDSGGDAMYVPPADGPFACGGETCAPTQFCTKPCTCGGFRPCTPPTDAGTCPPGEDLSAGCCVKPCTNPPPTCADTADCAAPGQPPSRYVTCVCPG